jgi:hypothetical protein
MTALEKRVENLVHHLLSHGEIRAHEADASDLRELLRLHKQAKRELAVCKKALRIERDYEGLSGTTYELLERENVTL